MIILYLLIIVISVIILLCVMEYRKKMHNKESFQNNPQSITPIAKQYQINKDGVEKCDILRVGDSNIQSYVSMLNLIDTGRIKKFKPDDTSKLKPDRQYCYIDNDSSNNFQDFMMFGKECSTSNSLFKNNSMITNVFTDITSDMIHSLPIEKCVLEIDPESVNNESLDAFYAMHTNSLSCEGKVKKIRNMIEDTSTDYFNLSNVYLSNVSEYERLLNDEKIVSDELQFCMSSLQINTKNMDSISNAFNSNISLFGMYNSNMRECVYNTSNAEDIQKTSIRFFTDEKINANLILNEKIVEHNKCKEEVGENTLENEKYIKLYNNSRSINNVVSRDNIDFKNEYNLCQQQVVQVKIEEATNKKNADECYPYIEKYRVCAADKIVCDRDNNQCTIDRTKYKNMSDEKYTLYTACTKTLQELKERLQKCFTEVAYYERDNNVKQTRIVVNDKNIDISSNVYVQCLSDKEAVDAEIKVIQQANTDLYNELEKINRECTKEKTRYISSELDSAKIMLEEKIMQHQQKAKEYCTVRYNECKIGLDKCTNAYVAIADINNANCVDSNNCSKFSPNEQYCAEQCVAETKCQAIYYNPKDKQCYKFNKPYSTEFVRKVDPEGGYTGNFVQTRSKCPIGSINCMNAIGTASDKNIVAKTGETSFDNCTYTCHETSNCHSVSYDSSTGSCTLFNNYYDTQNNENEPIRHDDKNGQTANLDPRYCIPKAWSAWSGCQLPEGAKCGLGEKTRSKPRGGIACPSVTEKEECFVSCLPQDKKTDWSMCSTKCGTGVRRRYTDASGTKVEEQPCTRDFGISVYEDDYFKKRYASYTCKNTTYLRDDRYSVNPNPFGVSSYQADKNVASVEFWDNGQMTHSGSGIVKALGDVDLTSFDIIMKPDESTIPFESIVAQFEGNPLNEDKAEEEPLKRIPVKNNM